MSGEVRVAVASARCSVNRRSGIHANARSTATSGQAPVPLRPGRRRADALGVRQPTRQLRPASTARCCWRCATGCSASTRDRRARAPGRPPYDPASERFNDGKCDPQGRFWVGTIYEPRDAARRRCTASPAASCCSAPAARPWPTVGLEPERPHDVLDRHQGPHHLRLRLRAGHGRDRRQRVFARFPLAGRPAARRYGGRPDGAAVDADGCYWVAMFEGQRLLRLSPAGEVLREVKLPVRCCHHAPASAGPT